MERTRSRNCAGLSARTWLPVALAIPAVALTSQAARAQVSISATQTTPVSTATANNGSPADIIITSAGTISPASGNAVTINSNNSVTNQGSISFSNANSVAGIAAQGGFSGTITNSGTINITDSTLTTVHPYITATPHEYRFGIYVSGPFNGTIDQTAGSITVEGNDSAGINIGTGATLNAPSGSSAITIVGGSSISVTGDSSYGILTNGALSGGINIQGTITVLGASLPGDSATTGVQLNQAVGGQLYVDSTISATGFSSTTRPTDPATFQALNASNLAIGGSGIAVAGGVSGGIEVGSLGNIDSFGSAAALQITSPSGPTTIGANPDNPAGLLIIGQIQGNGVYDSIGATGIQIGGPVTISGGINNGGSVTANAYAANATALAIGSGANVGSLFNTGTISSTVQFGQGGNAATGGVATAILDQSGSLISIKNQGLISATSTTSSTAIALDLRSNASNVTVTQSTSPNSNPAGIVGDVLFGSGNATLNLASGTIKGDVAFGSGTDNVFNITGGTTMTGALTTTSSGLNLNATGGRLQLSNTGIVDLTTLNIGNAGEVDLAVDGAANKATEFVVSGGTNIAATGKIGLDFTSKVTGPETFTIVQTQTLTTGSPTQPIAVGNVSYFYNVALSSSATAGGDAIDIAISPRTASQAGIVVGASAFNAIFDAFDRDPSIEGAFNHASTGGAFQQAYEQMLPNYAGGLFQALLEGTNALTRAEVGSPIYPIHGNRTGAWFDQFGFAAERSRDLAPGYHGGGLGFAFGWENPLSQLTKLGYAVTYMRGSTDAVDVGPNNTEIGTVYAFGAYLKRDLRDVEPGLEADAAVNIGYTPMKSIRQFQGVDSTGASFFRQANAAWDGAMANAHVGVSYEENLGPVFVRPHVAADYFTLYEQGRAEHNGGNAFDLAVASRTSKEGSGEVGLTIGTSFGDDFVWRPQITAGWKELFGGPDSAVAQFVSGGPSFVLAPQGLKMGGYFGRFELHGGDRYTDISFQAGAENFGDYNAFDGKFTARFKF